MSTTHLQKASRLAGLSFLTLTLTACGGSSDSPTSNETLTPDGQTPDTSTADTSAVKSLVIDASAGGFSAAADDPANKYTYFNFNTGEVVELTDAESEGSSDWHIGFKRTKTKLNGGVSGPGSASGAVGDRQDEYYDADEKPLSSVFLNVNAADELASLEAVTTDEGVSYQQDRNEPEIVGDGGEDSWWSYDFATHKISANPDVWNIVRGAAGDSYAKVHVIDIVQASRDITVELFIQGKDETAFNMNPVEWTANIGASGGALCYDFDSTLEVPCADNAASWDLQLEVSADGRSWFMWTNGGIKGDGSNGARFGPVAAQSIDSYPSSADVPGFFADAPSGVFVDNSWYAYGLQGQHKIYPNYRVYIVDTGSEKYKFQITSYYHPDEGSSGVLSVRYAPLGD